METLSAMRGAHIVKGTVPEEYRDAEEGPPPLHVPAPDGALPEPLLRRLWQPPEGG